MSEVVFVGVTTASSLVHAAMPLWRPIIGSSIRLVGVDSAPGADDEAYLAMLDGLQQNAEAVGAVVTTHKVGLFGAAAGRFAYLDPLALECREINAVVPGSIISSGWSAAVSSLTWAEGHGTCSCPRRRPAR